MEYVISIDSSTDATSCSMGFPDGSVVKHLSANAGDTGDMGLIPGFGKSLGQRSLAGSSPWGCKELDTTEQLSTHTLPLFQAWCIWAQKAKQCQQLWCGNTKHYLGHFSTRGAMYASLSPSFLTLCRILPPSSGIPFRVSLLLSNPQLTEHLVLKHCFYSKDSANSWIFNDILCLISVAHWMIHPLSIFCKSSCGYSIWIPGLHENAP